MTARTAVQDYLTSALAGSLIGQMAMAREISVEAVLAPNSLALQSLRAELSEIGIIPEMLAEQTLHAVTALFIEPDNADRIATELGNLLWTLLGDPESGGPPEIYRRAGHCMHLSFIGLLSPDILEPFFKQP
jgi:hypothetical protein